MNTRMKKSRAQTLVEMALVLPILLLLVLGLIEFGRALFIYTVVSNAAREGVRQGIVTPKEPALVLKAARDTLVLVPSDTVTIDVRYDDGTDGGTFTNPDLVEEGKSRIRVTVSSEFSMITPVLADIFPKTTISFVSARTIVAGVRAHKPTDTPPPPPPPLDRLYINFVTNYPCRGLEGPGNKGYIRVKAIVTDQNGNLVNDATVTVQIDGGESGSLTHSGHPDGVYGATGGTCWVSTDKYNKDKSVIVTATKTGFIGDSDVADTGSTGTCTGSCP